MISISVLLNISYSDQMLIIFASFVYASDVSGEVQSNQNKVCEFQYIY